MRIIADRGICRGHAQCVVASPELFTLDGDGRVTVLVPEPDGAHVEDAYDAADVCPVQAITLRE